MIDQDRAKLAVALTHFYATAPHWPSKIKDGEARPACECCAQWLLTHENLACREADRHVHPDWPWLGEWVVTGGESISEYCECGNTPAPFTAELCKIDSFDEVEEAELP